MEHQHVPGTKTKYKIDSTFSSWFLLLMERNELYAFISRFIVQRRLYRDENVENKTATDGQRKYTEFKLLSVSVEKRILMGSFTERVSVLRIGTDVASSIIECKHHDIAEMACERHMQTSNYVQSSWNMYERLGTKNWEQRDAGRWFSNTKMSCIDLEEKTDCQILESLFKIASFVRTHIK